MPKKQRFELVYHTVFLLFQSIFNLFRYSSFYTFDHISYYV